MPRRGEDLEEHIEKVLRLEFGSRNTWSTSNSGAKNGDNDHYIRSPDGTEWQIEAKQKKSRVNTVIDEAEWEHLEKQAYSRLRRPVLVSEDTRGRVVATLDFNDLVFLLKGGTLA